MDKLIFILKFTEAFFSNSSSEVQTHQIPYINYVQFFVYQIIPQESCK